MLSITNIVPKQYFIVNINNHRLSVEEFIIGYHNDDGSKLSNENINILIDGLSTFHAIDFKDLEIVNILNNDKFYFSNLSKVITYNGEQNFGHTIDLLEKTNNTSLVNYLDRNKEKLNLIKNFLNKKIHLKINLKILLLQILFT
jgi:hypothetical protein